MEAVGQEMESEMDRKSQYFERKWIGKKRKG
jgi:hypothetical protein